MQEFLKTKENELVSAHAKLCQIKVNLLAQLKEIEDKIAALVSQAAILDDLNKRLKEEENKCPEALKVELPGA